MHDRQGVFGSPPPIEVDTDATDPTRLTLKAMITRWWVLAIAWLAAGVILGLLGHPGLGALQVFCGLALDTAIQKHLRKRLTQRDAGGVTGDGNLGQLVFLRFALGMAGVLIIALWRPSVASACVLVLMQAWFLCVAVVQFSHAWRLMACALAPVQAALWLGLAPAASVEGGAAIFGAAGLLSGVMFILAREVRQLSWTWITAARRNVELRCELIQARDEAVRANLAKSQFLAAMSHEIRTPLNGMLGMAQVMAEHSLDAAQRDRLDVMQRSGQDLAAVLSDILDLSKVEAGRLQLEDVAFDLEQVLISSFAAFQGVAETRGLTFLLECRVGSRTVSGDADRLRQILSNLLGNALKFTERGKVCMMAAYEDGRLTVDVVDTGIGMAPQTMARLFQPYVQGDASMARNFGGAGLGLSIARHLIELMGGSLKVSSALGSGSCFTLSIPLACVPRPEARPAERQSDLPPPAELKLLAAHAPLRVLAADDHPINRLVLAAVLKQVGIAPALVENGRQAVDAWIDAPWDLILMDVQMPVLDGVEATLEIRELEANLGRSRTPILALTAHTLAHHAEEYRAAGMDDLVPKPLVASRLFEAIGAVLADHDQRTAQAA